MLCDPHRRGLLRSRFVQVVSHPCLSIGAVGCPPIGLWKSQIYRYYGAADPQRFPNRGHDCRMHDRLTNTQRHNRIFALVLFGYLGIGTIHFLVVDPDPMKLVMVISPVVVSVVCILIAGIDYFGIACLISTLLGTGVELSIFANRLGGWHHQRFWLTAVFLIMLNVVIYVFTVLALSRLLMRIHQARRNVEVIDYKGKFGPSR